VLQQPYHRHLVTAAGLLAAGLTGGFVNQTDEVQLISAGPAEPGPGTTARRRALPSDGMRNLDPTRTPRLLLALACCLALLAPAGAAVRAAARRPAAAAADELARTPAGLEQDLLRDRVGPLLAPGGKRDDRERPGPALAGVLAAALATAGAWSAATRRGGRPARRRAAAAAGARAPPPPQLASI
jgi:hypothetical protein